MIVNVQEWGCFSIFRRADDVTRTMSKGGGACECLHPPPPPSGNPVSAPATVQPVRCESSPVLTAGCHGAHQPGLGLTSLNWER